MTLLQTQGLRVEVPGRCLLSGLDLAVQPGERWCVLGPNGAGKTRLIETLAGLHRPAAGALWYQGQALASLGVRPAARLRALLAQHNHDAFDDSVYAFACSGRHPYLGAGGWEDAGDHAAVLAALARFELDTLARRRVHSLSGGERQRLALAAVLAQETRLLLLDEPLNHLDLRQQHAVLATLREELGRREGGLVCSLHDLNLAQGFATHALLLDGRGGHRAGPAAEVLSADALYQAFGVRLCEIEHAGRRHWLVAEGG